MREHAIPQDVTGYRFHIVGNMTLKQFAEVALGFVVAIILYKTNLIPIVKWPLILLSAGSGILIAFVPIEERPLDHWLTTFFSILYRPTQFFWRKTYKIPDPFLYKPDPSVVITPNEVDLTPARRQRIQEYLTSVRPIAKLDPWEAEQKQLADSLLKQFDSIEVASITVSQTIQKPKLQVRVRELQATQAMDEIMTDRVDDSIATETTIFEQTTPAVTETIPPPDVSTTATSEVATITNTQAETESSAMAEPEKADENTADLEESPVIAPKEVFNSQLMQTKEIIADAEDVANQIMVPISTNTQVETTKASTEETDQTNPQTVQPAAQLISSSPQTVFMVNETSQLAQSEKAVVEATHRSDLPFPSRPTVPNKVVGMVFTPDGKLLPGAIVEIRNMKGEVARAVKTNPLGQFFITTPLDTGEYIVVTEKAGHTFVNQQLILNNTIVDPLQIVSQA